MGLFFITGQPANAATVGKYMTKIENKYVDSASDGSGKTSTCTVTITK